jgi:hypothetical protein
MSGAIQPRNSDHVAVSLPQAPGSQSRGVSPAVCIAYEGRSIERLMVNVHCRVARSDEPLRRLGTRRLHRSALARSVDRYPAIEYS